MASRLDQPGDPYRCCLCPRRSRAHLCHACYATHLDPATGALPDWVLTLQRQAARTAMRELRAYRHSEDPDELALAEHERVIEHGLATFNAVGSALAAIRDQRLYRAAYDTFEAYCQERWQMSRIHAHRLIEAAEVCARLLPSGNTLPANEAQARPLATIPADEQAEVWQIAVETAPNGKVTAAHVARVARVPRAARTASVRAHAPTPLYATDLPAWTTPPGTEPATGWASGYRRCDQALVAFWNAVRRDIEQGRQAARRFVLSDDFDAWAGFSNLDPAPLRERIMARWPAAAGLAAAG